MNCIIQICKYLFYNFNLESEESLLSQQTLEYENCIDSSLINDSVACNEVYDPVCGCDGITYSNFCYTTSFGGLTFNVSGEYIN